MSTTFAPNTSSTTCPSCAAIIPVDEGYVAWCERCGWNTQPRRAEPPPSLIGRAFVALGRRSGKQLFEGLAANESLRPGGGAGSALAFLAAGLVHAFTLGLAVGGLLLIVRTWFNLIPALLGGLMIAIAWQLRPRLGRPPSDAIARAQAPALFTLIDRVAQALGHPPVELLVLDHRFNASYYRAGWRGRPVLTLGLPLMAILGPQQRAALVGHELGHGVNGDPLRGLFVRSAVGSLQAWYTMLHPLRLWEPERGLMAYAALLANLLLYGLAQIAYGAVYLLSLLAWRSSQQAEYLADDLAARVAGAAAKRELLLALQLDGTVDLAVQRLALGQGGDVVAELERAAANLPARERERLRRAGLREEARLDATHPPTALRMAMIERRSHPAPAILLDAQADAAITAELRALSAPVRRRLIDTYRSRLYAG